MSQKFKSLTLGIGESRVWYNIGMNKQLIYEDETYAIRGAIFEVYKTLGSGFLEDVYQHALEEELRLRGIPFEAKKTLHVMYKGRDCGLYEPDILCYGKIILELKATDSIHPKHEAQLMNYLSATGYKLGLLVNFGAEPVVDIRRRAV